MLGNVNVKLRPIKIAFLVDPRDRKAILQAIEITSFLWGGSYNPIIPVLKRIPGVWKKTDPFITFRNTAREVASGYIDVYDPDFFVVLGKCDAKSLHLDKERVIAASDVLGTVDSDGTPSYGMGLLEILRYFIDKEMKFVRRRPLSIYFPDLEKRSELFLASVFGKLPGKIHKILLELYRDHLDTTNTKISVENYATFLDGSKLFSRRLTSLYIDARPSNRGSRNGCIFFLDAQDTYDVIDYWNLRAMAWPIIPVPRQSATLETTKRLAREFIEQHFGQSRHNPQIFYNTTIMKSRSVDESEVLDFIKSLGFPKSENPYALKFVFQRWYPRLWDEWARDKDGADGCELGAGENSYGFSETDTRINIKTVDPKFVGRFGGGGEPRFANILDFHFYGEKELVAEVIPAGAGIEMVRAIGGTQLSVWRFSRKELIYLSQHSKWNIHVSVPLAREVFSAWMKSRGWEVSSSSPGTIAYQMTRRLGGVYGLSILSHEGVLNLLRKMENGKVVGKDEFTAEIARAANQNRILSDRKRIAEWLLDSGMIRLGAEFQCPVCQQRSWFSMKDLDYQLQCHNCSEDFDVPAASPEKIKWAYKAFGPFSLPGRAYGVYSVLLTLRFFSELLNHLPTTPMLSFLAEKDGKEIEIDLALFLKETTLGINHTRLVFAECKNNDEFKKHDIDKMNWIAAEFPGAIIVCATLNKQLSNREKRLIVPFVNKGRKQWKTEQPYNPVLVLTATELLSDWGPPECWRNLGEPYNTFADSYQHFWHELIPLCDITQQMYLGLKPWQKWLAERRERIRKNRIAAI